MGKGDRKSRKGKIFRGSFGKSRPRKIEAVAAVAPAAKAAPAPKAATRAKKK